MYIFSLSEFLSSRLRNALTWQISGEPLLTEKLGLVWELNLETSRTLQQESYS
jgi:hypothetical protein